MNDLEATIAAEKRADEYQVKLDEALNKVKEAEEKSVVAEARISDMEVANKNILSEVDDLKMDLKSLKDIKESKEKEAENRRNQLQAELYHANRKALKARNAASAKNIAMLA